MLRPNLPDTDHRLVFGYLRLPAVDPTAYAERRQQLEEYGGRHELRLGRVFVDEGYGDEVVSRAGFSQLCILLRLERPDGVLFLRPDDLSSNEDTALQPAHRVWAAAVDIYVVHGKALTIDRQPTT
jgi:hypothetical protein